MGSIKATKPQANPPICGECDRMLYGRGRFYHEVMHNERGPLKVHEACAVQLQRAGELMKSTKGAT